MTSPAPALRLPAFVIVGAMKAGTTSVHRCLSAHGDISIPDPELHLFDIDDPAAHPRLHRQMITTGRIRTFDADLPELLDDYARHFASLPPDTLIGEDSTTYLYSHDAPRRMAAVLGDAKIVVMLRDPVERLISHYWHNVARRTTVHRIERAVERDHTLMARSTYTPGLGRFIDTFGRDRVHVELLEDLRHDMTATVGRVRDFLGLPHQTIELPAPSNPGVVPARLSLALARNRLVPNTRPSTAAAPRPAGRRAASVVNAVIGTRRDPPPLPAPLAGYLARTLTARNAGLDELLGRDLTEVWPAWTP